MTQKTISVPDDIYNALKKKKREDESFPQVLERLLARKEKKTKIRQLTGVWKEDGNEWDAIEKEIYKDRIRGTVAWDEGKE
jgi:predicted CopG family antitoxin